LPVYFPGAFVPRGRLEQGPRKYDLVQLIHQALLDRPDLVALRHTRDDADSNVSLAKTEKIPDVACRDRWVLLGEVSPLNESSVWLSDCPDMLRADLSNKRSLSMGSSTRTHTNNTSGYRFASSQQRLSSRH
jgi:hypothetical protein